MEERSSKIFIYIEKVRGVPIMAQRVKNPARIQEDIGGVPGLNQWVKFLAVAVSFGEGCRCGLDLALLWLLC